MFCSWKKRPSAPCSCAFILQGPLSQVLNHLCHFGQGTLILKQPGLSLAKATPFGLCVAYREGGWNRLQDRISGLETDVDHPQCIHLLNDGPDGRPLLAMGAPGREIELSIRLDDHQWGSPPIEEMISRFGGVPLDCLESRRLGAGAWLDDWGDASPTLSPCPTLRNTSDLLHRCRLLEVEIKTRTHRNIVRFAPSFIDSEGPVLRIADKSRKHVVYANIDDRDFQFTRLASQQFCISRDRSGDGQAPALSQPAA